MLIARYSPSMRPATLSFPIKPLRDRRRATNRPQLREKKTCTNPATWEISQSKPSKTNSRGQERKQACGDAAVEIRKLREQGKQMVLLEQKIKIIQWREKLDMQMRAGFEFTNMCRVKSKKLEALHFFST